MKIGVISLYIHTNYGGILQAYALQTVLKRMGHQASLIQVGKISYKLPLWKKPLCYSKRLLKKIKDPKTEFFFEEKQNHEIEIIAQHTRKFIQKHISISQYKKFKGIQKDDFDAYVVGSDQVWRPKYFSPHHIENAYLKFTKDWNVKRISYAASFGVDTWEYNEQQTNQCRNLIKKFDRVSVREDSGASLCKEYLSTEAIQVIDPTLLLGKDDYISLYSSTPDTKSPGTLMYYILDENKEILSFIEKFAKENGFIPFRGKSKTDNIHANLQDRIQPPLENWLKGFNDAEFIITDSFHACVFSIIFQKPFIVFKNPERGISRIASLLKMFHLENRIISKESDISKLKDINWNVVYEELEKERTKAFNFLKEELVIR